jgi:hypothetical protein
VLPNFRKIAEATAELLEPQNFARFCGNAQNIHNRALFEIPVIFEKLLRGETNTSADAAPTAAREPVTPGH